MALTLDDLTECFFDPDTAQAIDAVHPNTGRGVYGDRTLDEVRAEYPQAVVCSFDEARSRTNEFHRRPPVRVSAETFTEMLEILPPQDWVVDPVGKCQSFKMSEYYAGDITAIYARVDGRCWEIRDRYDLPHAEIVQMCRDAWRQTCREAHKKQRSKAQ